MSFARKLRYYFLYALYVAGIVIIFLEIFLRFYYPFPRKIRGDQWELATNVTFRLQNDFNPRLDPSIVNKRNSIGFRGEEPMADMDAKLSILAIGGSTTACTFLNEDSTWPDRLRYKLNLPAGKLWVNNAGLDGHSTYGHLNFLHHYMPTLKFRPRIALVMVGANDVDRNDLVTVDSSRGNFFSGIKKWLKKNSETITLINDLKWILNPVDVFSDKQKWNFTQFRSVHLSDAYIDSALQKQQVILKHFNTRLNSIIAFCRKENMQPVLITQPSVFGDGTAAGGNPALDFHVFHEKENGQLFWKKLQLYNKVTKQVAAGAKVPCIDLATLMPKDTLYYYDIVHFTNQGAEKVADIVGKRLNQYMDSVNFTNKWR